MSKVGGPAFLQGQTPGPRYNFASKLIQRDGLKFASINLRAASATHSGSLQVQDNFSSDGWPVRARYTLCLYNKPVAALEWQKFSNKSPILIEHVDVEPNWQRNGFGKLMMNIGLSDMARSGLSLEGLRTNPTIGYKNSFPHTIFPLLKWFGLNRDVNEVFFSLRLLENFDPSKMELRVEKSEGEMTIPYLDVMVWEGKGSFKLFLIGAESPYETDPSVYERLTEDPLEIAHLITRGRTHIGVPYMLSPNYTAGLTQYALSLPVLSE